MAPTGRVGITTFLNVLHNRPIETGLTPEQYEGVKLYLGIPDNVAAGARKTRTSSASKKIKKKKKEKKKMVIKEEEEAGVVELPSQYMEFVESKGGSELKLVVGKRLTKTDVSWGHDRVSMPSMKEEEFLTREEARLVRRSKIEVRVFFHKKKKEVRVFDPKMKEKQMYLATWNGIPCLHHGWKKIVANHDLQAADAVQVWSFRVDSSLCLLVHKVEE